MSFNVGNATKGRSTVVLQGEVKELYVSAGDNLLFSGSGWNPLASVSIYKGGMIIMSGLYTDEEGYFTAGSYYIVPSNPPLSEPVYAYINNSGWGGLYGNSGTVNLITEQVKKTVYFEFEGPGTTSPYGAQIYDIDVNVGATAYPDSGYDFIRWEFSADGVNYDPTNLPYSFTNMPANDGCHFKAIFGLYCFLTVNLNPSAGGSVRREVDGVVNQGPYLQGENVRLTAIPKAGYDFAGWSGAISGSTNPTTIIMNGDKTVTATFTKIGYTITIMRDGTGSGTVSKNPNYSAYDLGAVVTLTALPSSASVFEGWSGSISGSANPTSVTVNGDKVITATFTEEIPTYRLSVTTSGGGTVTLNPSGGTYYLDTIVTLTADPPAGGTFVGWGGALSGTENPTTIKMTSNKTVMASFTGGTGEKTDIVNLLTDHKLTIPLNWQGNNCTVKRTYKWDPTKTTVTSIAFKARAYSTAAWTRMDFLASEEIMGFVSWPNLSDINTWKELSIDAMPFVKNGVETTFKFDFFITLGVSLLGIDSWIYADLIVTYTGEEPTIVIPPEPWGLEWWQWGIIAGVGIGGLYVVGKSIGGRGGGSGITLNIGEFAKRASSAVKKRIKKKS